MQGARNFFGVPNAVSFRNYALKSQNFLISAKQIQSAKNLASYFSFSNRPFIYRRDRSMLGIEKPESCPDDNRRCCDYLSGTIQTLFQMSKL